MNTNKEGSGLLIVIILMSGLILYLGTMWRATAYLVDISLLREQYEKEYVSTFGLMHWAISLAKNNFVLIQKKASSSLEIKLDSWPPNSTTNLYAGKVEFVSIDENTVSLCTRIESEFHTCCALKCNLVRSVAQKEGEEPQCHFAVSDWQHASK